MKLKYSQGLHSLTHTSHYKTVMIGVHVVVAGHKLFMQKLMMAFFFPKAVEFALSKFA